MNIQQAIKAAAGGAIRRTIWSEEGPEGLQVQPTDGPECCIISVNGENAAPRWCPPAEDLAADDWQVVMDPEPALLTVTFITPDYGQAQAVCEGVSFDGTGHWQLEGVQHADWQPDIKAGSYVTAPAGYQLASVTGGA